MRKAKATRAPDGGLAVARQRGHVVERAGLGLAAVARDAAAHAAARACRCARRPRARSGRPGPASRRAAMCWSSRTTWRGVVRLARESPEPSATRGRSPKPVIVRRTTAAPARVVPPAPNSSPSALISVSALKLSDGRLVSARDLGHRRRALLGQRQRACLGAAGARRAADHDVAALERALEGAGGEQRRPTSASTGAGRRCGRG